MQSFKKIHARAQMKVPLCMLILSFADFFKINFFEILFKEYHQSVKQLGCQA